MRSEVIRAAMEAKYNSLTEGWYCAATVVDGDQVLVYDSYPKWDHKIPGLIDRNLRHIKFVGGSRKVDNGRFDRSPIETLERELQEELFASGRIVAYEPFFREQMPWGYRYFNLIKTEGLLRQHEFCEPRDKVGFVEKCGVPYFMSIGDLAKVMFGGHLASGLALCNRFGGQVEAFGWAHQVMRRRLEQYNAEQAARHERRKQELRERDRQAGQSFNRSLKYKGA